MEEDNEMKNELADGVTDLPTSLGSSHRSQYSRSRTGGSLRQTFSNGRDSFASDVRFESLLDPRHISKRRRLARIDHPDSNSPRGIRARVALLHA